jgi:hypothetical protein
MSMLGYYPASRADCAKSDPFALSLSKGSPAFLQGAKKGLQRVPMKVLLSWDPSQAQPERQRALIPIHLVENGSERAHVVAFGSEQTSGGFKHRAIPDHVGSTLDHGYPDILEKHRSQEEVHLVGEPPNEKAGPC